MDMVCIHPDMYYTKEKRFTEVAWSTMRIQWVQYKIHLIIIQTLNRLLIEKITYLLKETSCTIERTSQVCHSNKIRCYRESKIEKNFLNINCHFFPCMKKSREALYSFFITGCVPNSIFEFREFYLMNFSFGIKVDFEYTTSFHKITLLCSYQRNSKVMVWQQNDILPWHEIEPCTSCFPGRCINHFTRKEY